MPSSPGPPFFAFVFGSPTASFVFSHFNNVNGDWLEDVEDRDGGSRFGGTVVNMYNSTFSHSVLVACR